MDVCKVVTAGKTCLKKVCTKCIWYVGRKKQNLARNIPGGDYNQSSASDITIVKGSETTGSEGQEWEEVETSCSKCLRHVEFRWKELAHVQDAFGGFMP
eukprot:CAMPEP_0172537828 /NCGR_PEP_ID=MMETSP1067-20121228/9365_1 /TAXON_ID=265564 ORGANISM="Thalassiosira punctigera, Strain Tpunct2005C2" /NCGR_SAMPLE_ID=MMETSP1067 /ASSEMBLY_ACC=CAM_ASM_000444 /LENGTH=98 /DNA_ID=CAMNT_0013323211 /DNA_START=24 /DNA_END=320 /DNA_ORIENTATION=+